MRLCCRRIDAPDESGLTRVHRSVIEQDVAWLDMLVAGGADYTAAAGPLAVQPLHLAVLSGDERTACLDRLLSAGVPPDAPDAKGTTSLHAASTLNLPNVCTRLLKAGVRRRSAHTPCQEMLARRGASRLCLASALDAGPSVTRGRPRVRWRRRQRRSAGRRACARCSSLRGRMRPRRPMCSCATARASTRWTSSAALRATRRRRRTAQSASRCSSRGEATCAVATRAVAHLSTTPSSRAAARESRAAPGPRATPSLPEPP